MKIQYLTGTSLGEECNSSLFRKIIHGNLWHLSNGYPSLEIFEDRDLVICHTGVHKEIFNFLNTLKSNNKNIKVVLITCKASNWFNNLADFELIKNIGKFVDLFLTPHLDHIEILKVLTGKKVRYFNMPINLSYYKREGYIKNRVEFGIGGLTSMRGYLFSLLASKDFEGIEKVTLGVSNAFKVNTKILSDEFGVKIFPFITVFKDYLKLMSTIDVSYLPMYPIVGNSRSVLERAALGIPTITTHNILIDAYDELKINYWEIGKGRKLLKDLLGSSEFRDSINKKAQVRIVKHDLPIVSAKVKKILDEEL